MAELPYKPLCVEVSFHTPQARAVEVTLGPHEQTPWHTHSHVPEYCYCLEGQLRCDIGDAAPETLVPGRRAVLGKGLPHRLSNATASPCRFLIIHGAGAFDFVERSR